MSCNIICSHILASHLFVTMTCLFPHKTPRSACLMCLNVQDPS